MMDLLGFAAAMPMRSRVGTIAVPGATGNVAYTGLGFKPSAIVFMSMPGASGTLGSFALGFTDGVNNRLMGLWGDDSGLLGGGNAERNLLATRCVGHYSTSWDYEAAIVSMDLDGFTLNWTNAGAGTVYYLAMG